jgi:hypothetical protein
MKFRLVLIVVLALLAIGSYAICTAQSTNTQTTPAITTSPSTTTSEPASMNQPALSSPSACSGATAICSDGTCSYSAHRRGTCSHHGGVRQWVNRPPN